MDEEGQITRSKGGPRKEGLQGSGFSKRGCDHCEVGPPRRIGRGGSRREVAGVGRRDEKQWLERRREADSR